MRASGLLILAVLGAIAGCCRVPCTPRCSVPDRADPLPHRAGVPSASEVPHRDGLACRLLLPKAGETFDPASFFAETREYDSDTLQMAARFSRSHPDHYARLGLVLLLGEWWVALLETAIWDKREGRWQRSGADEHVILCGLIDAMSDSDALVRLAATEGLEEPAGVQFELTTDSSKDDYLKAQVRMKRWLESRPR